jgi:hypothetical protein
MVPMTRLEEIERMARAIDERRTYSMTFEATADLARFILAVLPTIRAASEWRDTVQSGHIGKHDKNMNTLIETVSKMREELK